MNLLRKSYPEYLFILKEYLITFMGIHYPKEIIILIMKIISKCKHMQISCQASQTILVYDNYVYTWGKNIHTSLIYNIKSDLFPREIIFPENIELINCGGYHTVVSTISNRIYIWGSNDNNQLGLGHSIDMSTPQEINLGLREKIIIAGCGKYHNAVLTKSFKCYVWGYNTYGQLGLGHHTHMSRPQELKHFAYFIAVSCGGFHTLALTSNGICYTWGRNDYGQLGLGGRCNWRSVSMPQKLYLSNILGIYCGENHSVVLTTNLSKLWVWGDNLSGQLGLGNLIPQKFPRELVFQELIVSVSCGRFNTMALTESGQLYGWGSNAHGQLGLGNTIDYWEPKKIFLCDPIVSISSGDSHTVCITTHGKIYVWGSNLFGQLGLGDFNDRRLPQQVKL